MRSLCRSASLPTLWLSGFEGWGSGGQLNPPAQVVILCIGMPHDYINPAGNHLPYFAHKDLLALACCL